MIVMGSDGISHVATHVRQAVLATATDAYAATDLRFTAMCLDLIAEDYDRAVDVLVSDRNELEAIFRAAHPHLDGDIHSRVGERLADTPGNLRVRTLSRRADDDMRVLIELHQTIDDPDRSEPWLAELNTKIWRFIERYAERRKYQSPI